MMMYYYVRDNNKKRLKQSAGRYIYVRYNGQKPEVTTFWVYKNQIMGEDTDINYLSGKEYNKDE